MVLRENTTNPAVAPVTKNTDLVNASVTCEALAPLVTKLRLAGEDGRMNNKRSELSR